MKKSGLLKLAKKHIETKKEVHICRALDRVCFENSHRYTNEAWVIQCDIFDLLTPYNSAGNYLALKVGVCTNDLTAENLKAYRLRWMDHLIKQYKAKGD